MNGSASRLNHVLIVHELGRRWIDLLRFSPLRLRIRIRHSVRVHDTLCMIGAAGRSLAVVELGRDPVESLDLVERARAARLDAAIVVIGRADQVGYGLAARELGATLFLSEPMAGTEFERLIGSIVLLQAARAPGWENSWEYRPAIRVAE